jgi:hypothetical protein
MPVMLQLIVMNAESHKSAKELKLALKVLARLTAMLLLAHLLFLIVVLLILVWNA